MGALQAKTKHSFQIRTLYFIFYFCELKKQIFGRPKILKTGEQKKIAFSLQEEQQEGKRREGTGMDGR